MEILDGLPVQTQCGRTNYSFIQYVRIVEINPLPERQPPFIEGDQDPVFSVERNGSRVVDRRGAFAEGGESQEQATGDGGPRIRDYFQSEASFDIDATVFGRNIAYSAIKDDLTVTYVDETKIEKYLARPWNRRASIDDSGQIVAVIQIHSIELVVKTACPKHDNTIVYRMI